VAEYIEREALLKSNRWLALSPHDIAMAKSIISGQPAADVVEVVRCKDCMYGEHCYPSKRIGEEAEPAYWCKFMDQIVSVDGYCAYGKKMDGKGEGECG
jgi:hypothetical protein